jgi:hypothetical protein
VNKYGGTKSLTMFMETKTLLLWCQSQDILLRATHIKGSLNVMADLLSRDSRTVQTEWSILPEILEELWEMWYKPEMDMFATRFNRKLVRFVSPFPDPEAWGVDAMTMDWDGLCLYAFPPFALVGQVIRKMEQSVGCNMILIAPYWPARPWFGSLMGLITAQPLQILKRWDLLKQPCQNIFYDNLFRLDLHAWKISSVI